MSLATTLPHDLGADGPSAHRALRIGIDLVRISAIEASLGSFGERFLRRLFHPDEVAYAVAVPSLAGQRLAARFAAKEAAIKAFGMSEAGITWRDIEVRRAADGACSLRLHGRARTCAERTGCTEIALSLSHDGDYATAMVAAVPPCGGPPPEPFISGEPT